jgi:5-methylcytosine-specific restriction protein A
MTRLSSTVIRRLCFERHKREHPITGAVIMHCGKCDFEIDPVRQQWEADHIVAVAIGGSNEPDNLQPLCVHCHKEKTKTDVTSIAKGKRMAEKHYGIKRSKTPMPCGRRSPFKKKLDGSVVRRDSE